MCLLSYIIYSGCCHVYFCCVVCSGWNSRCLWCYNRLSALKLPGIHTFQVWYTLVKGSIFICLYTLWAAAVDYKSSPKNHNPRLCNFSRDCIFKITHSHYPGNTGSLYTHHTLIDNLPRCDDGKKLGSNLIKRLICVKKNINALNFFD